MMQGVNHQTIGPSFDLFKTLLKLTVNRLIKIYQNREVTRVQLGNFVCEGWNRGTSVTNTMCPL